MDQKYQKYNDRESHIKIKQENNPSYHDYMNPYVNTMEMPTTSLIQREYRTRERKGCKSSSSSPSPKKFGEGMFYGFPKPDFMRVIRSHTRPEDEYPLLAAVSTPKVKKRTKKNKKLPILDEDATAEGGTSILYRDCSQRGSFKYTTSISSIPAFFNEVYVDPLDLKRQPTQIEKLKKDTLEAISMERKSRNRGRERGGGWCEDELKLRNSDIFEPRDGYEEPVATFYPPSSFSSSEKQQWVHPRSRAHVPKKPMMESDLPPKLPPKMRLQSLPPSPPPPILPHLIPPSRRRDILESGAGIREKKYKKRLTGGVDKFESTTSRASSTSRKDSRNKTHDNDNPRSRKDKNVFKALSDTMKTKMKIKEGKE